MIIVVYGINGVGKDRIAREISRTSSEFLIISQSRLLMYHLGIATSFTFDAELEPDAYKKLELIGEKEIADLGETSCRKTILDLSTSGKTVLYLSHLAVAKFFQGKDDCSVSEAAKWIKKEANGLVFIKANLKDILAWRKRDKRKRSKCLAEISLQRRIAEEQWEKLIKNTSVPYIVIKNRSRQIQEAVRVLIKFIKEI